VRGEPDQRMDAAVLGVERVVLGHRGGDVDSARRSAAAAGSARSPGPAAATPRATATPNLRSYLCQAAMGAAGTSTFPGERYRRIARRRGAARAQVAVARTLLVIIWHLLANPQARYQDLGPATTSPRPTRPGKPAPTSASSKPSATPSPSPPPKPAPSSPAGHQPAPSVLPRAQSRSPIYRSVAQDRMSQGRCYRRQLQAGGQCSDLAIPPVGTPESPAAQRSGGQPVTRRAPGAPDAEPISSRRPRG
jgi:hypothetical protein